MNAVPQALPIPSLAELEGALEGDLASLRPGESAIVVGLDGSAKDSVTKLLALGVVPGIRVLLESHGPAVVFRMGHARFAVDRVLASAVRVRRTQSDER